jgi:hypothetical protein
VRLASRAAFIPAAGRLVAIAGNYGSGKTELAVNICLQVAAAGGRVQIADLDIVNPYFRCRDAQRLMQQHGVRVVVPPGAQIWADLPIILPEIRGMLRPAPDVVSIFDVGGDDVGARVLAAFRPDIDDGEYELLQVINARRPFTDSIDGCLQMRDAIEAASRWTVTGFIVNTHLIDETTPAVVMEGWALASALRSRTGLPIRAVGVMADIAAVMDLSPIDAPVVRLGRIMRPPWLEAMTAAPAARPVPIGRGALHGSYQH